MVVPNHMYIVSGGMCNVLPCYLKHISVHMLIFLAAVGCVAVSFLFPLLPGLEMNTIYNYDLMKWTEWMTIVILGLFAVPAQYLTFLGCQLATPPVASMVRKYTFE